MNKTEKGRKPALSIDQMEDFFAHGVSSGLQRREWPFH